jgi:peptidoglycan/xylan/chitin deacetylase (PgdA/CDA1 family)
MARRRVDHAVRVAAAALIGAVLAGAAGFAILDHQRGPGVLAQTSTQPPKVVLASPSIQPVVVRPPEEPPFGSFRAVPRLDAVEPITSGVQANATILMTFDQPMDRQSVELSFQIQPSVDGRFVWRDDFTVQFNAFRLANATTYLVEVRGRSSRGVPLAGARLWSFTTESGSPDSLAPGASSIKVPILTYHYIRVNPDARDRMGFALSVTPTDFAAQMDWLARSGYHTITTEDLHAYLSGARGLPSKPVILTFDDGYADFYTTALPILRTHDFRADLYVVSGFVGRPGYVTAAQVRESDRSGIEIGSHTVTHADLARTSAGGVRTELVDSRRYLEALLGHPVYSFCYPSGKFTGAVAYQVAAAGYHDGTTTMAGYWHSLADRYVWTRLRISGGESLAQFAVAVANT